MNLMTDKKKASQKGVVLLSVIMTLCILALFAFQLNTYARAVLSALVVLCVFAMRSLRKTGPPPPAIDPDAMVREDEEVEAEDGKAPTEDTDFIAWMDEAIDSETLLQEPGSDQLNRHVDFMQGAMKKDKRQSHKNDL